MQLKWGFITSDYDAGVPWYRLRTLSSHFSSFHIWGEFLVLCMLLYFFFLAYRTFIEPEMTFAFPSTYFRRLQWRLLWEHYSQASSQGGNDRVLGKEWVKRSSFKTCWECGSFDARVHSCIRRCNGGGKIFESWTLGTLWWGHPDGSTFWNVFINW